MAAFGSPFSHLNTAMNILIISQIIILFVLSGCAPIPTTDEILTAMYNVSSTSKSAFDGSTEIRVDNIFCGEILFNVIQNSHHKEQGKALLQASLSYAENIGKEKSLKFNIDGEYFEFSSYDYITQIDQTSNIKYDLHDKNAAVYSQIATYHNKSTKTYLINESLIHKLATAKKVIPRLYTLNRKYIDGNCMRTIDLKATGDEGLNINFSSQEGFKKFLEMSDTF